jgi:hypothetical protein
MIQTMVGAIMGTHECSDDCLPCVHIMVHQTSFPAPLF